MAKTRTDFVSNSSSCSFIISNPDYVDFSKKVAIPAILGASSFTFSNVAACRDGKQLASMKEKAVTLFMRDIEFNAEGDDAEPGKVDITIDNSHFRKMSDEQMSFIRELAESCEYIYCDFGCDDNYDNMCRATQSATLLDYVCNAKIDGDDHFGYSPVGDILDVIEGDNQ